MSLFTQHIISMSFYLILLFNPIFAVEINSSSHAINIAGKQRMYSQRMLKNYAMIGMNNSFGNPSKDLKSNIRDFDAHLDALYNYTKNTEIKSALNKIKTSWLILKKDLMGTAQKAKVASIQEALEELLKASDDVTQRFSKLSTSVTGEIVNLSGRQRMLSQRMASLYMLQVWGMPDPKFKTKLTETLKLFKASHQTLEKHTHNTASINTKLKSVKRSFTFFEMMSKSSSKYIPSLIYNKSNKILKVMNEVTAEYVILAHK